MGRLWRRGGALIPFCFNQYAVECAESIGSVGSGTRTVRFLEKALARSQISNNASSTYLTLHYQPNHQLSTKALILRQLHLRAIIRNEMRASP